MRYFLFQKVLEALECSIETNKLTFSLDAASDQVELPVHAVFALGQSGDGGVEVVLEHDLARAIVPGIELNRKVALDQSCTESFFSTYTPTALLYLLQQMALLRFFLPPYAAA